MALRAIYFQAILLRDPVQILWHFTVRGTIYLKDKIVHLSISVGWLFSARRGDRLYRRSIVLAGGGLGVPQSAQCQPSYWLDGDIMISDPWYPAQTADHPGPASVTCTHRRACGINMRLHKVNFLLFTIKTPRHQVHQPQVHSNTCGYKELVFTEWWSTRN